MTTQQNKKITLGILLTFIICIGSAILATYSTGPYGNYPNPGVHPGMIGPGTFNTSGAANPQWSFPGGITIGNPAGGNMGTGTINAEEFYKNGILFNGRAGGIGGLECAIRNTTGIPNSTHPVSVTCESGEVLTGGSCSSTIFFGGLPSGNTWSCISLTGLIPVTAYAICCNVTGGGTSTEEKYCKRTNATYTGNLGGIAGADAKCQAEFGAGWSFADTKEEVSMVMSVDPLFYFGLSNGVYSTGYDGHSSGGAWIYLDSSYNCHGWTSSSGVGVNPSGTTLYPDIAIYGINHRKCFTSRSIWCCPP